MNAIRDVGPGRKTIAILCLILGGWVLTAALMAFGGFAIRMLGGVGEEFIPVSALGEFIIYVLAVALGVLIIRFGRDMPRWKRALGFVLFGFVALDILIIATQIQHNEQLAFGAIWFVILHVMGGVAALRLDKREQRDVRTSGHILL